MTTHQHRTTVPGRTSVRSLGWLFGGAALLAFTVLCPFGAAQTPGSDPGESSAPSEDLLRYSLQVEVPTAARRDLKAARDALARGDIPGAVADWRRLAAADPSPGFIPLGDSLIAPHDYFRRLLPLQSPEVRGEWQRATALWATQALTAARARNDLAQLRKIAHQATGTTSGRQAALETAVRFFDARRSADCAAACAWLLDAPSPDMELARGTPLVLWWAASLEQLGERDDAIDVWARFHQELSPALLHEADRDLQLGPMLHDWKQALAERARSSDVELPEASIAELLPANLPASESETQASTLPAQVAQLLRDFETIAHPLLLLKGSGTGSPPAASPATAQPIDLARRALGEALMFRDLRVGDRIYRIDSARRLEAIDALTGNQLWRTERAWPTVLSEPFLHRRAIHVLTQELSELRLTSVNVENGAQNWSTRLGTEGLARQVDPRRQWMPALGIGIGELLICATGNGAVVAVDANSGEVDWVHRVSREDWRDAGPPLISVAPQAPRIRLWAGWREPVLWRAGDVIVWTSPEADRLLGLDRRTGETVWSRPRGEGLAVQSAPGHALIFEPGGIRSIRTADGSEAWVLETPPLAGLGFVEQGWIVIPLRTGGTIAVRLRDGRVVRGVDWDGEVAGQESGPAVELALRTLTKTPEGILVRDLNGERVVPTAASMLNEQSSPAHLAAAGRLEEAQSRLTEAESLSPETVVSRTREQLRLRVLQRSLLTQNHRPLPTEALPPLPLQDIPDPNERLTLAILQWRLQPDINAAVALLTAACQTNPDRLIDVPGRPLRQVRGDALAAGSLVHHEGPAAVLIPAVNELWDLSPAASEALESAVASLEQQRALDAVDRVLVRLIGTRWGAERWLSRMEHGNSPVEKLSIAERVRIDLQLARLEQAPGAVGERAAQLRRQFTISATAAERWPRERPNVTVRKWASTITTRPVERSLVAQGATDRLQVEINFQNGQPRFSGAGEDRPWSPPKVTPDRSLHVVSEYQRAWLLGSMVLVQAGSRLIGVTPFDADGRRDAEHLWPLNRKVDTWGTAATANVGFLPRIGDAGPGRHPPDLDEFGRSLAQVGPVSLSWFGLRQFGRFIALESTTGRRLWERERFEKSALACGDDGVVVLLRPGQAEVLSPFDGRLLRSWNLDFELSDVIDVRGRTIFVWKPSVDSPGRDLMAIDGATGRMLWKQPAGEGAQVCSAGRFQILVSSGTIRVIDSDTGNIAKTAEVETPAELTSAAAIADEHALIVLASGPPALGQARQAFQSTGGHRRPFANGRLIGFDPQTLELRWSIPMEKTVLPLDQAPDVPVLVINDAVYDESLEENLTPISRLRCLDKRTGELLYEGTAEELGRTAHVVERNPARLWVEVRTSKAIVRFDYSGTIEARPE